jgi:hypothetical protein
VLNLSFAKTRAALSPAIALSQELIAVLIVTAGRLNIPTCVFRPLVWCFPSKAALNNL